jgi:hypothetical protein
MLQPNPAGLISTLGGNCADLERNGAQCCCCEYDRHLFHGGL